MSEEMMLINEKLQKKLDEIVDGVFVVPEIEEENQQIEDNAVNTALQVLERTENYLTDSDIKMEVLERTENSDITMEDLEQAENYLTDAVIKMEVLEHAESSSTVSDKNFDVSAHAESCPAKKLKTEVLEQTENFLIDFDNNKELPESNFAQAPITKVEQWEDEPKKKDEIFIMFAYLNAKFFQNHLKFVNVEWSHKLISIPAVSYVYCNKNSEDDMDVITIALSAPMLMLGKRIDIVETLLHQMIHTHLYMLVGDGDHGANFIRIMEVINKVSGTDIRDYTGIDMRYWFRCNSLCRRQPPFYGCFKGSKNFAPGNNEHAEHCDGIFIEMRLREDDEHRYVDVTNDDDDDEDDDFYEALPKPLQNMISLDDPSRLGVHIRQQIQREHHSLNVRDIRLINMYCATKTGRPVLYKDDDMWHASLVDVYFDDKNLIDEFKRENDAIPCCSYKPNHPSTDIIICPLEFTKMKRWELDSHLDSCIALK